MLSRAQRLPSVKIPILLRRGARVHTESIDFLYQNHQTERRFACIVSKKVEKHAVGRNRTKRLVHSALQTLLPSIGGVHGVFVVRRKMQFSQEEVTAHVRSMLEKAGVIE